MENRPTSTVAGHAAAAALPTPRQSTAIGLSAGATEDQVNMVDIVPERVNKHGTKIEDLAGTGQHDSLGG